MEVLPAINCQNKEDFERLLVRAKEYILPGSWMHVDVSDEATTKMESFFDKEIILRFRDFFKFEIHAMVSQKDLLQEQWFLGENTRTMVHWKLFNEKLAWFSVERNTSLGAVVYFDDQLDEIYIPEGVNRIEVLAVPAGPSGGSFHDQALRAISFLKERYPNVIISVDGGINMDTARKAYRVGARAVVSSSYIWNALNPRKAYEELKSIS